MDDQLSISRRLIESEFLKRNRAEERFTMMGMFTSPAHFTIWDRLGAIFKQDVSTLCPREVVFNDSTVKVLTLLEACFDLILDSLLSMKIQIMGGKITENLGFKSPLRKVKKILFFFLFLFKIFT